MGGICQWDIVSFEVAWAIFECSLRVCFAALLRCPVIVNVFFGITPSPTPMSPSLVTRVLHLPLVNSVLRTYE